MILRDIENTLTGRHITNQERISEALRAIQALLRADRVSDAWRVYDLLRECVPFDEQVSRIRALLPGRGTPPSTER